MTNGKVIRRICCTFHPYVALRWRWAQIWRYWCEVAHTRRDIFCGQVGPPAKNAPTTFEDAADGRATANFQTHPPPADRRHRYLTELVRYRHRATVGIDDSPAHSCRPPVGHHRQTRAPGRSARRRGRILGAKAPVHGEFVNPRKNAAARAVFEMSTSCYRRYRAWPGMAIRTNDSPE